MAINLIRIDDRLIHGQVVEGWLGVIGVNHIIIASDEICRDIFQQSILSLAVPSKVYVNFYSIQQASEYVLQQLKPDDNILVLVHNPTDALRLMEAGVKIPSINVGGMHFAEGKKQVLPFLSVDECDRQAFEKISQMHIRLEGRVLPDDQPIDIIEMLHKVF